MIPILHGLSEIAERYDGFIVDLWGVLHDGMRAFPRRSTAWSGCASGASAC